MITVQTIFLRTIADEEVNSTSLRNLKIDFIASFNRRLHYADTKTQIPFTVF